MPAGVMGYDDRQTLIDEIRLLLGDQMVDVELDSEHYTAAIDRTIATFRQLSGNSVEDSILFLTTQAGVNDYTLPNEVMEVSQIYRRGIGTNNSGGTNFDPFDVAFNNMYMLQAGQLGGLAVFDAFAQYKETIGRIFGNTYNFVWNTNTKNLKILRNISHEEEIAIQIFNIVPESVLLKDPYASPWIADFALAWCKQMLSEAYGKFASGLPGAGGGIQLKADKLAQDAVAEFERLRTAITEHRETGGGPLPLMIG